MQSRALYAKLRTACNPSAKVRPDFVRTPRVGFGSRAISSPFDYLLVAWLIDHGTAARMFAEHPVHHGVHLSADAGRVHVLDPRRSTRSQEMMTWPISPMPDWINTNRSP